MFQVRLLSVQCHIKSLLCLWLCALGSDNVLEAAYLAILSNGCGVQAVALTKVHTLRDSTEQCASSAGGHIPYRDSKLTRILQPSLGGNAKTAIICNITPALIHTDESHSTLRFACRAKRVVNNAVVNEVLSDAAVLKRQAHEIEELRKMLTGSG